MKWLIAIAIIIYVFYLIGKRAEKTKNQQWVTELLAKAQAEYDHGPISQEHQ